MKKVNNITNTDGMNAVTLTTDTAEINSAEATAEEVTMPEAVAADASPEVADAPVVASEVQDAPDAPETADAPVGAPEAQDAPDAPETADAPVIALEAQGAHNDTASEVEAASPVPKRVKDELHVSNVVRDGENVEIILYKMGEQPTMTIHYDGKDVDKKIPYVEGIKKYDKLPDGGLVVAINEASSKRVYATLTVSITEIADKFSDKLSELSWIPRTKTRKH